MTVQRMLQDLIDQLDLETLELNLFRGESRDLGGRSVFGGQVIGQALVAAARTVAHGRPHSLHAYFLRRGDMAKPIIYEVDRVRDGAHFTTRRVQAIQHGAPILSMIASFQAEEDGLEHAFAMPDVPAPETLPADRVMISKWINAPQEATERVARMFDREQALEFRFVPPSPHESGKPAQSVWFRATAPMPDEPILHQCVLAYASDFNLLGTAFLPHGLSIARDDAVIASIDHALWFHRPLRVDDWLLYAMDSPSAQSARGFTRGTIFDRSGRLVASTAQEGLMRQIAPGTAKPA